MSESIVYADLVHPADLPDVETELEETGKKGGREFVKEYRILTEPGDVRWVEEKTFIRRNEGVITHYQGIIVDITERKQGMS
ncbi:MAG: PAS domain-containing protein [Methanococcoides sp.]|nr:PAS domain-containing protein [Methanococcoides sp.]